MPLLFMLNMTARSLILIIAVLLSVGCSSDLGPKFDATGYISNSGAIRFWRLDNAEHQPQTVIRVYTPYLDEQKSVFTRFEFINGSLSQVIQRTESQPPVTEQLRFDAQGNVTFQQRQLIDRREPLSKDDIDYLSYIAQQSLQISGALIAGNVKLVQGQYQNDILIACEGKYSRLSLDTNQRQWLASRAESKQPLWLAWLDAPNGIQLLLAANEDFCLWQPTEENM